MKKIDVVVVTSDSEVIDYVKTKRNKLIPANIRTGSPWCEYTFYVTAYPFSFAHYVKDLPIFVHKIMSNCQAVIILCESQLFGILQDYTDSIFLARYDATFAGSTIHNYMNKTMSRLFGIFSHLFTHFQDQKYLKALLLPLRNFNAKELTELREAFHKDVLNPSFRTIYDESISELRARRHPKKYARYKAVYLVDDDGRFFSYGIEKHARVETTQPPHRICCELNSRFRFGYRYDAERHFNVSFGEEGASIGGKFRGCHEEERDLAPTSHLNMFPNDFVS